MNNHKLCDLIMCSAFTDHVYSHALEYITLSSKENIFFEKYEFTTSILTILRQSETLNTFFCWKKLKYFVFFTLIVIKPIYHLMTTVFYQLSWKFYCAFCLMLNDSDQQVLASYCQLFWCNVFFQVPFNVLKMINWFILLFF